MDHDKPAHRQYDEKEIGVLIQRATEIHQEAMGASERCLSLEEIAHIAAELGLPPEYVRTAALELEARVDSNSAFSVFGGPFVIEQTRVVDETMTEQQWKQVIMELRAFTGKKGQIDEVGSAHEWTYVIGEGDVGFNFVKTRVAIRPRNGQTSIQIREDYGGMAVPAYLLTLVISTAATVTVLEFGGLPSLVNFAVSGGVGLGALAIVRGSISLWARRQKERLKRLINLLHQTLSPPSLGVLANEPATELIELPEMDDSERVAREAREKMRI